MSQHGHGGGCCGHSHGHSHGQPEGQGVAASADEAHSPTTSHGDPEVAAERAAANVAPNLGDGDSEMRQVEAVLRGGSTARQKEEDDERTMTALARSKRDEILTMSELYVAFLQAKGKVEALEDSPKPAAELGEEISQCLSMLALCEEATRRLEVFSKNETVEDVNTEDLAFVLINFYAGKVVMKTISLDDRSGMKRLAVVRRGKAYLDSFLEHCSRLHLLDETSKAAFEALHDDDAPVGRARELKMERYRQSKTTKQRLDHVAAQLRRLQTMEDTDEDLEREKSLLEISCAVNTALDDIMSANQEEDILQHMAKMSLQFTSEAPRPPPQKKGLEVTHIGKDLVAKRETIKSEIFRPSWSQPTMSLREVADIEMREAMEREARSKAAELENPEVLTAENLLERGLEDDKDLADKAAKKDRDWDDWKDDHPKGRGVTKRF